MSPLTRVGRGASGSKCGPLASTFSQRARMASRPIVRLGATLIDRSARRAGLTTAGVAALDHARAALASVDAMRQAVDEVNGLIRGQLTVGMVTACTVAPLFDILAAFHRAHPGIEITLIEDEPDRLVERVRSGMVDFALIGAARPPEGLQVLPVVTERLVAAVPLDHPLAATDRAVLADLNGYPIVCMPPGTGVRAVFDQACNARGIHPNVALQASAPSAVADLATRGLGVAILSESMAANYRTELHPRILDDIETPALLAFVWASAEAPALQELLRYSRDQLQILTASGGS
jgi:DNA-binding transcriptional LysR family regulator